MKFRRIIYAFLGLFLFVLGIVLLKDSVEFLLPFFKTYIPYVDSPVGSLGFGWILSYIMLSGAPPAILSLSLLHMGVLTRFSSYMMVMGTRLGAVFILIVIGLVEYVRGRSESLVDSTSLAFLSFIITYTVFIPALFLGWLLLGPLGNLTIYSPGAVIFGIDSFFRFFTSRILGLVGAVPSFFVSFFFLIFGLNVFNKAFKDIEPYQFKSSFISFAMRRKWFSFSLGIAVTLVAASVSISIGILVPLYNMGYLERSNLIPYIMGASVATFISHFVAAMLLESSVAFNVVLAAAISSILITLIFLYFYDWYSEIVKRTINFILLRIRVLVLFVVLLLILPISMVLISIFFGY